METDELKCSWWTNSYNKDENIANVNPPCSLGAISEDDDVSTTLDSRKESNDHVSTKSSSLPKHAYQISCMYISVFSSLGCVIRIGVDHAVGSDLANIENPGSVVFRSFFSNILGCYLLGILHSLPMDRGTYLFIGLSTGLCGAVTTYSKWNQQVSMLLVGNVAVTSQPQVVAFSAVLVGMLSFICAYQMGKDTVRLYAKRGYPTIDFPHLNTVMIAVFFSLYVSLAALIYALWSTFFATLCLSAILGPLGANLRYILSKETPHFRSECVKFLSRVPTGTLFANAVGSCLLALTVTMQAWLPIDCNWQIFIAAVQSGFLASLTTVSTFVGELVIMRTSNSGGIASSYLTAFATLLVCLSLASIINGTSQAILMQSFQNSALSRNMTYWQWEIQRQSNCSL